MKRSLNITILFLACFTVAFGIAEETIEEIEDGRSSSGAELRRQDGYTQKSASGGNFVFFGSKRPRASAVRTAANDPYVGGDRTAYVKPTENSGNYDHNLHTAYRLPLQRLSDNQLNALLKRYSPEDASQHDEMTRVDMINKVQEQIVQRHQRKLIRPKLLTNINVLPEDVTIDSEPAIDPMKNRRTTVGTNVATTTQAPRALPSIGIRRPEIRRSQKQIPEIDIEEPRHTSTVSDNNEANGLRSISHDLQRMKTRYDSMRIQYLRRLRELNERKISLATPQLQNTTSKTLVAPVTDELPIVDNETPFDSKVPQVTTTTTASVKLTSKQEARMNSMINKLRRIVQKAMGINDVAKAQTEHGSPAVLHDAENAKTEAPKVVEVIKPVRAGAPRAQAIPRQYTTKTVVVPASTVNGFLHDGGADEIIDAAVTAESVRESDVTVSTPAPHEGGFKIAMKKVLPEISTDELIIALKDEYKSAHGPLIPVDSESGNQQVELHQDEEIATTTLPSDDDVEDLLTTLTAATEDVTETTPIPVVSVETPAPHSNEATTTVSKLDDDENEKVITVNNDDELNLFAETDEESICEAVACDFEKGDLCQWEASNEEVKIGSPHYRKHRGTHYVRRTWHNWRGLYRNRVTGIARAQVFSFDNQRFAASYVRPFQRSTLTATLYSGEADTIRFRAWEATRDVQLRVCCDTTENCVFETDIGVMRGSRQWREYTATCPKGSSKIIFECINTGVYQGACGVDNVHLVNDYCPTVIPNQRLLDSGELRRHRKH